MSSVGQRDGAGGELPRMAVAGHGGWQDAGLPRRWHPPTSCLCAVKRGVPVPDIGRRRAPGRQQRRRSALPRHARIGSVPRVVDVRVRPTPGWRQLGALVSPTGGSRLRPDPPVGLSGSASSGLRVHNTEDIFLVKCATSPAQFSFGTFCFFSTVGSR